MDDDHARRLHVALLAGGDSPEREVSLRSGAAVASALDAAGFRVTAIDPADRALEEITWSDFDACFLALHGGAGEDGRIQQQLDLLGVPYTGSGPEACRRAMSKCGSKALFRDWQIASPPFVALENGQSWEARRAEIDALGYPLVIKPDQGGSSLGLSVVADSRELPDALALAFRFDDVAVIEPLIAGREFTVALLDDHPLPTLEVVKPAVVFSYEDKYRDRGTEFRFEFELPAVSRQRIARAASRAARSLGTAGLVRADLILHDDGTVYVLEVNAIPGMTERSLAPLAAAKAGIEMPELCLLLVQKCLTPAGVV